VITFSETWLNSNIPDEEIKLDNYVLYRKDRGSRGGGLVIYLSTNLITEPILPNENPRHFEGLFFKVIFLENKRLIIGNIYKPPSAPAETTDYIFSTINSLDDNCEKIILGDFNSNWLDCSSQKDHNLFNKKKIYINLPESVPVPHLCLTGS